MQEDIEDINKMKGRIKACEDWNRYRFRYPSIIVIDQKPKVGFFQVLGWLILAFGVLVGALTLVI